MVNWEAAGVGLDQSRTWSMNLFPNDLHEPYESRRSGITLCLVKICAAFANQETRSAVSDPTSAARAVLEHHMPVDRAGDERIEVVSFGNEAMLRDAVRADSRFLQPKVPRVD